MEAERLAASDRTLVPNRFVVHLHPADLDGLRRHGAVARLRARRRGPAVRPRPPLHPRRPAAGRPARRPDRRAGRHPGRRPVRRPDRRPIARRRTPTARRRRPATDDRPTRPSTMVFAVPQPGRPRRPACASTTRTGGIREVVDRGRPDHRPRDRQRPRPARRARLAPPRPDRRPARDAGLHRPRQHQRVAGQRACASARSSWAPATGSGSATRRSSSRSTGRPTDGRLPPRPVGRPAPVPGLLYLFLFGSSGPCCATSGRRRASRPAELGRLVVVASPGGEPAAGPVVRARRHHDARARRQQRDRHRRPVRVGRARGPDLPRPGLVRRGPRQHERVVRQRRAASRASPPLGFGDELQVGQVRLRLERARR